ncbi:hypothetical protein ACFWBF_03150 [Streptomyces sp. NPDC060028]|uniref:hypothetical protein n=1 Tax=Streptomyces sp. NPDC060028 TaxID=3347041 RepID=UPI00368ED02C
MKRRLDAIAATAAALAAAVVLAGCAASAAPRAVGPVREPDTAEVRLLERAEQILISGCMRERGFPYAVTESPDDGAARRSFPYAVDDVEWARAHGYGGRDERRGAEARRADPNQQYFHSLSAQQRAAARTALMGRSPVGLSAEAPTGMTLTASTEGCIAQAQRSLYGDLAGWFRAKVVTMNLRPAQETRVREDRRYADAVGEWAGCMRAAGRPYATPLDSRQAAAGLADAAETELAVIEATCATGTPLARVSQALDLTYGEEVRARHQDEIDLRRRLQNDALPMAERVVAQHDA